MIRTKADLQRHIEEVWSRTCFELICGGKLPPPPAGLTLRNGRIVPANEEPKPNPWKLVRTDAI